MADAADARRRAEEALRRVLANAAAIVRLSWSDGATAADRRNLERIKSAAADIAQDHKILRALLAALPGEEDLSPLRESAIGYTALVNQPPAPQPAPPPSDAVREAAERLRRARESNFLTCTDSRVRAEGNRVLLLEVDALLATLATVTAPTLTERKEKDYEDARCEAHSLLRSLAPELAPHKSLAVEITQISDAVAGLLAARGGE